MKRKIILVSIFIIALISLVLYYTLATDITMKETTGTADLTYNININDTDGRTITVEAGKTKIFDIFITNKNGGSIKYGLAYKPTTTTDIKVKKLNTSINDVTGIIANNTTLQVTLVIDNTSTSNLTYNIVPITGYEKGGDLIVSSGYTTISEVYEFEKSPSYATLKKLGLTANKETPNFSQIATTDEGIYGAVDDYGTSYYFRGASTKNYVKFANKWWRIIRINGDGSIRMIYDGTTAHNNGESSTDREIGTSNFNSSYSYSAYIGYMYGQYDASLYADIHKNINDSTIKGVVDIWYKTNIKDAGFEDKVADTIYCNDRSMISDTATGTTYKAYSRIVDNKVPILACAQQNDRFTVEDTTKGNGALTYPVGLITIDEVSMAGGVDNTDNSSYYLYTGQEFWTMSPSIFTKGRVANEFDVYSNGSLFGNKGVNGAGSVRPVISLKADTELSGTGTKDDPFKVVTASDKTLTKLGLTAKDGTPDFSQVATTDEGIYAAVDDYGKSYYFRGAVTNNYVKFANKWWRIIRINGDGTIRMIYDGTTAHNNGESSTDRQIGTSPFNSSYNDNAYVGYMYGSVGVSTYEETHENTNNSTIKIMVDNWYKINIVDTGFSDRIADVVYCNDRSLKSGIGIGTAQTYYKAQSRIIDNKIPRLTCSQQNDAFTVADTTKGNGALTYSVGLITIDEVSMAGGLWNDDNTSYYLYSGSGYLTMAPEALDTGNANEFYVGFKGSLNYCYGGYTTGVRPVISLRNDVEIIGTGTKDDPFTIKN